METLSKYNFMIKPKTLSILGDGFVIQHRARHDKMTTPLGVFFGRIKLCLFVFLLISEPNKALNNERPSKV